MFLQELINPAIALLNSIDQHIAKNPVVYSTPEVLQESRLIQLSKCVSVSIASIIRCRALRDSLGIKEKLDLVQYLIDNFWHDDYIFNQTISILKHINTSLDKATATDDDGLAYYPTLHLEMKKSKNNSETTEGTGHKSKKFGSSRGFGIKTGGFGSSRGFGIKTGGFGSRSGGSGSYPY
jgi:hypothetical protein